MFDSNEIDEYLDQFMSERSIGQKLVTPTKEDFTAVEFVTKNINFEPEITDYEVEWITESVKSMTTDKSLNHAYKGTQAEMETDPEKELERDIMELISNADLREILLESMSTATMPSTTQKNQETNKKRKRKSLKRRRRKQCDQAKEMR